MKMQSYSEIFYSKYIKIEQIIQINFKNQNYFTFISILCNFFKKILDFPSRFFFLSFQ